MPWPPTRGGLGCGIFGAPAAAHGLELSTSLFDVLPATQISKKNLSLATCGACFCLFVMTLIPKTRSRGGPHLWRGRRGRRLVDGRRAPRPNQVPGCCHLLRGRRAGKPGRAGAWPRERQCPSVPPTAPPAPPLSLHRPSRRCRRRRVPPNRKKGTRGALLRVPLEKGLIQKAFKSNCHARLVASFNSHPTPYGFSIALTQQTRALL